MREETLDMQRYFKLNEMQVAELDKEVDQVYAHLDYLQKSGQIRNVYNLRRDVQLTGLKITCIWMTQPEIEFAYCHVAQ